MGVFRNSFYIILISMISLQCSSPDQLSLVKDIPYDRYPEVIDTKPDLPSPFMVEDETEYVIAMTKEEKYAIIPVTLSNDREICRQLIIDTLDFPQLVKTGLHSVDILNQIKTITGWSLDTITELGRPGGLSHSGFMAGDEDIISVIRADNRVARQLGLTHPQLAKPLFHVLNLIDMDLSLNRWNMARHQWENITCFFYNDVRVFVEAYDTKGGQMSIFNDCIEGAFHVKLWHEFNTEELEYIKKHYSHLSSDEFEAFKAALSFINIGEMQPQYIMRYGFYEGHTFWRACPVAISFIFGFRSLEELNNIFEGKLNEIILNHYTK